MKKFIVFATMLFMIAFSAFSGTNAAQYNAGTETADVAGLNSGLTVGVYNSFYSADAFKNSDGKSIGNFDTFNYTAMLRAFYLTDYCFLGAKYGFGVGIPVINNNFNFNGIKSDEFSLGDIYIEPVILKWAGDQYAIFATLGVFAPTSGFDFKDTAILGQGAWTGMGTLGAKYYLDSEKTWGLFSVARYEMSSENTDSKLRAGDVFTAEYGITKAFKFGKDALTIGAVGYNQVQSTDNKIDGATITGEKMFTTAVGPALGYHFDSIGVDLGAKVYFELGAENKPEGMKAIFAASKSF